MLGFFFFFFDKKNWVGGGDQSGFPTHWVQRELVSHSYYPSPTRVLAGPEWELWGLILGASYCGSRIWYLHIPNHLGLHSLPLDHHPRWYQFHYLEINMCSSKSFKTLKTWYIPKAYQPRFTISRFKTIPTLRLIVIPYTI